MVRKDNRKNEPIFIKEKEVSANDIKAVLMEEQTRALDKFYILFNLTGISSSFLKTEVENKHGEPYKHTFYLEFKDEKIPLFSFGIRFNLESKAVEVDVAFSDFLFFSVEKNTGKDIGEIFSILNDVENLVFCFPEPSLN